MPSHASPDTHVYLHIPTPLFKARVNMPGTVTYPVTALTFDGVTLGAFGDIEHDMTLVLGTTDGADDLGRTRVQKVATSTQIPVARVSRGVEDGTLEIVDNAYITVYADDFRVWAKLPYQDPNGTDYKDGDVPVGTFLTNIPPVVNMGSGFADYIDPNTGLITGAWDASGSVAMADGATISTYAWDVGAGTITVGTASSAAITATFPAGHHVVSLTITDSNGVSNTGRRPVVAVDPANDVTIQTVSAPSYRFTQAGQSVRIGFPADIPRSIYPDGTLCMIWDGAPSSPSDRSHMKFIGWHQSDDATIRAMKQGYNRETTLECVDVAGRLDTLPGFPQALQREAEDDVDIMWSLMPGLTINKALHYLIFWHSTALGVADFFLPPTGDDYPSMRLDSVGATLYDQLNSRALSMCPDHILTCNAQGQLSFLPDWMTMDVGDRPTIAVVLTEDDYSDLQWPYQRPPKVHVLRASAVVTSTSWIMLGGEKTLPLAFSIAPGTAFSQGTNEAEEAEGLAQSQTQLNVNTGHRYARLNARFGPVRVKLLDPTTFWDFQPALMQRIQLNIGAQYAAQRGLPFTQVNAMVKELTIRYVNGKTGTALEADAVLELETSGPPAVTHVPETTGDPDDYETPPPPPPTVPPGVGSGENLVAAIGIDGYVYRTSNFQSAPPTWDRVDTTIADTIYSWVVDPFSPGYINGSGAINGWIANDTAIYRVADLFGSVEATAVFTFPVATNPANFHWRTIQASFGAYFGAGYNPWLMCVSYYGSTVGHEGTWATYSTDGGATWSAEVQISELGSSNDPSKLPRWGLITNGGAMAQLGVGTSASTSTSAINNSVVDRRTLICAPPANAKRLRFRIDWSTTVTDLGVGGGNNSFAGNTPSNVSTTGSGTNNFSDPPVGTSGGESGSYESQRTLISGVWAVDKDNIVTSPPVASGPNNSNTTPQSNNWHLTSQANGAAGNNASAEVTITLIEIEFADGSIYTPVEGITRFNPIAVWLSPRTPGLAYTVAYVEEGTALFRTTDWGASWVQEDTLDPGFAFSGTIHVPWQNNVVESTAYYGALEDADLRQFRLKKLASGVITDVSPTDGTIIYGVNRGPFGVRTFDGAGGEAFVLAAVVGNDTEATGASDKHGVYISDDEAATWTVVVTPIADSGAPTNRPAFEAAFGGESEQEIFIWGPPNYISYSADFGATVLDKSGNIVALGGCPGFVGIAGGPTG